MEIYDADILNHRMSSDLLSIKTTLPIYSTCDNEVLTLVGTAKRKLFKMDQESVAPEEDSTPAESEQKKDSETETKDQQSSGSGDTYILPHEVTELIEGDDAAKSESQETKTDDGSCTLIESPAEEVQVSPSTSSSQKPDAPDPDPKKPTKSTDQTEPSTLKQLLLSPTTAVASTTISTDQTEQSALKQLLLSPTTAVASTTTSTDQTEQSALKQLLLSPTTAVASTSTAAILPAVADATIADVFICDLCLVELSTIQDFIEHRQLHDMEFEDANLFFADENKIPSSSSSATAWIGNAPADTAEQGSPSASSVLMEKLSTADVSPLTSVKLDPSIATRLFSFKVENFTKPQPRHHRKCEICGDEFLSSIGLEQHLAEHKLAGEAGPIEKKTSLMEKLSEKSPSASRKRSQTSSDEQLSVTTPAVERYPCDLCNINVAGYNHWRQHMMAHNPLVEGHEKNGRPWYVHHNLASVSSRNLSSTSATVATDDVAEQPGDDTLEIEEELPCPLCSSKLFSQAMLRQHLRNHALEDEEREADENSATGPGKTEKAASPRQKVVTGASTTFRCTICSEQFPDAIILRRHVAVEHANHEMVCPDPKCKGKFRGPLAYEEHRQLNHVVPLTYPTFVDKSKGFIPPLLSTPVCLPKLQDPRNEPRLTVLYQATCNLCTMKFKTEEDLERHNMLFHDGPSTSGL